MKLGCIRTGILAFLLITGVVGIKAQSAKDIVTKAENNIKGHSSRIEVTMNMKAWSKGEQ